MILRQIHVLGKALITLIAVVQSSMGFQSTHEVYTVPFCAGEFSACASQLHAQSFPQFEEDGGSLSSPGGSLSSVSTSKLI